MSLKTKIQNLKKINVSKIVSKNLRKNEAELIDLNTDQLYSGIDSKGVSLGTYTPFTQRMKEAKGDPSDRVTLKDEVNFYEGFILKGADFPFKITSVDSKTDMLSDKYGDYIFGITNENLAKYIKEVLLPYVQYDFKISVRKALQ